MISPRRCVVPLGELQYLIDLIGPPA